jgi:hypothetical protein
MQCEQCEQTLAIKWETEQEEMRRRRHPRKVMEINSTRVRELDAALASLPQGVPPDPAAERHLMQIFKDLPPDRAWWASHRVVRDQGSLTAKVAAATERVPPWAEISEKRFQFPTPRPSLPLVRDQTKGNLRSESVEVPR